MFQKPFWPSEKLYGYYEVPHHSWLDENANKGNVSLLQIANIFGNVLLIRLCFFERMPSSLREFLEDPSWLKVCMNFVLEFFLFFLIDRLFLGNHENSCAN